MSTLASKVNPYARPRVLLVDGDESSVELWCMAGPYLGLKMDCVTDPRTALSIFTDFPYHFDLVITGYEMEHLDGLELARAILKVRPDTPIILATACMDVRDLDADRAGCAGILRKPFAVTELLIAVELALKGVPKSPESRGEP